MKFLELHKLKYKENMKRIKIYQLNDFPKCQNYRFMSWSFVQNHNIPIMLENYDLVYEYDEDNEEENIYSFLDDIFIKFQGEKPEGYKGVSVSTSDIIMVDNVPYYVDSIGFQKIIDNKYILEIHINDWDNGSTNISHIISLNDLNKFRSLIKTINENKEKLSWNWFGNGKGLPDKWDGSHYVLDTLLLCKRMEEWFDYKVEDINLIKEFFLRFTPNGADHISGIKVYKVEEIEI